MILLILVEILFSFFITTQLYTLDVINDPQIILVFVLYLVLKLCYFVFLESKYSKYILWLIVVYLILTMELFYPLSVFVPLNLSLVLLVNNKKNKYLNFISLVIILYIPNTFVGLYLTFMFFGLFIVYLDDNFNKRMLFLKSDYNLLKDENKSLREQVNYFKVQSDSLVYQSQLEERNHLAQELHDELGHVLAGNIMRLEAIKLLIEKDPSKSKTLIAEVTNNLRSGMASIRKILKNVKPEVSSVNISNIKAMVSEVEGVDIELVYNSDIDSLSFEMWKVININLKEALTNMIKYSKATTCKIEFTKLNQLYRVIIEDNGIGCKNIDSGLGLNGMKERMTSINGNLVIDGSDGFKIVMLFKMKGDK